MPAEGMLGRLVLARVPGEGQAPATMSSGKSQASGRNPRAEHPGTGCGAEGLGEREQPLGPSVPGGGFKERRSWDGSEQAQDELGTPWWGCGPLGATFLSPAQQGQRSGGTGLLPSITYVPPSRTQAGAGGGGPPKQGRGVLLLGLAPLPSLLGVGNSAKSQGKEDCNAPDAGIA